MLTLVGRWTISRSFSRGLLGLQSTTRMKSLLSSIIVALCAVSVVATAQSATPTPSPTPTPYAPYTFTTLAGLPGGSIDGTGAAARFRFPQQVAVDASGNIFVGDSGNYLIRKVTPGGVVTTFAGLAGAAGSVDGTGSAARFTSPNGLVFDSAGNLYVADGNAIRKITPAGVVSTLVGGAVGTGSGLELRYAYGIVINPASGDLYVTDTSANSVCKVTADGVITLLAGGNIGPGFRDGQGAAASFSGPAGLAIDIAHGVLTVGDTGNGTLRAVGFSGDVFTSYPQFSFGEIYGLIRDANDNLFLADATAQSISEIAIGTSQPTPIAGSTTFVPGSADGVGAVARFDSPRGLALVGSTLYVADSRNSTIRKIEPGGVVTTLAGLASAGSGDGVGSAAHFREPYGVAVGKSGNVYVGDSGNVEIRKITPAGKVTTIAGQAGVYGNEDGNGSAAHFRDPRQVAVDGAGSVYVADRGNNSIRKITPAGDVTTLPMNLYAPEGVAVDKAGNLYVADTGQHTIYKRTPNGQITVLAGAKSGGNLDGDGSAARFNFPSGLAVDASGFVYVADSGNGSIRKITPSGTVTTLPGHWLRTVGVAVDKNGNVFVSDPFSWTISKISPSGDVAFIAGEKDVLGSRDGTGRQALFWDPTGLATDTAGRLYVADRANNTIRVGAAATRAVNISTRMNVGTDPDELVAGFIVTGDVPKKAIIRALGPSITVNGQPLAGTLQDPTLELHGSDGKLIRSNNDWKIGQHDAVAATGIAPTDDRESAIVETLQPGSYTAIVRGTKNSTGIGVVEVYDLEGTTDAEMAQISTRGNVLTGDDVMIGGFILSGGSTANVLVRAIGPELANNGVADPLLDPTLKVYNSNGTVIGANDNWRSTQEQAITDTGVAPKDDREPAVVKNLTPDSYTAVVSGKQGATGVALVEVYVIH